jgi:hypothetical protein
MSRGGSGRAIEKVIVSGGDRPMQMRDVRVVPWTDVPAAGWLDRR